MKKILFVLVCLSILLSCFTITVFAASPIVSLTNKTGWESQATAPIYYPDETIYISCISDTSTKTLNVLKDGTQVYAYMFSSETLIDLTSHISKYGTGNYTVYVRQNKPIATSNYIFFRVEESPIVIESLTITKMPNKTEYFVGEKFSSNGIIVTANYSDGSNKEIVPSLSVPNDFLLTSLGKSNVLVSYEGVSTQFTINIKEKKVEESSSKPNNSVAQESNSSNTNSSSSVVDKPNETNDSVPNANNNSQVQKTEDTNSISYESKNTSTEENMESIVSNSSNVQEESKKDKGNLIWIILGISLILSILVLLSIYILKFKKK